MPGQVRPVADERDGLLSYLAQMRYVLRLTAYGLTPEQLRATPSASPLSVGGLIKHCASTEEGWIHVVQQRTRPGDDYARYEEDFRLADGETIDDVFAYYDRVASETEKVATTLDLDHPVPVNHDVPWNPKDVDNWSLRWVLLHLLQETARHTGHADIIRESVDGGTAYPIMAAAEKWPASPWMQPWEPKRD
jgi:uncharacterized damage-inducible protein DinB